MPSAQFQNNKTENLRPLCFFKIQTDEDDELVDFDLARSVFRNRTEFIGNITASGNISGSATSTGSFGKITGTLTTPAQTNITSIGTLSTLTVDDITIDGSKISDSSNLTIEADSLDFDINGKADAIKITHGSVTTTIEAAQTLELGQNGQPTNILGTSVGIDASGDITLDAAGDQVFFKDNGTTSVTVNTAAGHITASGNISSSGDVIADALIIDNHAKLHSTNTLLTFADESGGEIDGTFHKVGTSGFGVEGNSANASIAASKVTINGGLYVFKESGVGHITASGDISSSGTITM